MKTFFRTILKEKIFLYILQAKLVTKRASQFPNHQHSIKVADWQIVELSPCESAKDSCFTGSSEYIDKTKEKKKENKIYFLSQGTYFNALNTYMQFIVPIFFCK